MNYEFWFGSTESFDLVLQAQASVQKLAASSGFDGMDTAPTWKKEGSVGIVPVSGPLIQGSAGWLSLFGITGYDDIATGLSAAVADPEVKSIMLDVNSPGGSVNGMFELSDYVAAIGKVKPVSAFINDMGGSAAYAVMVPAAKTAVSQTGMAGSIGAVMVHRSRARQHEANGIDVTVIRSGEHKMIGGADEPLSELAKADIQSKIDDLGAMFESHVGKHLNMSAADVRAQMGGGKVFMGKRAVAAGLVQKVSTRDQAVAAAKRN